MASSSQSSSQEEEEPQPSTSREDPGGNVKRRVLSSGSEPSGPSSAPAAAAPTASGKIRSKSQGDAMDVSSSDDDMPPAAFEPPPSAAAAGTLAVVPVSDSDKQGSQAEPTPPSTSSGQVYRSSVSIQISGSSQPPAGASLGAVPKQRPPQPVQPPVRRTPPVINQLPTGPRLQAFAVSTPSSSAPSAVGAANRTTKQLETRQRQLEMLRRMEERYKNMAPAPAGAAAAAAPPPPAAAVAAAVPDGAAAARHQQAPAAVSPAAAEPTASLSSCACQRLTVHVLDISEASTEHVVTWQQVKTNSSRSAPEETILYTLTVGHGEIVMFGGIQKDVSGMMHGGGGGQQADGDTVSNALYFLNPPAFII